MYKSSLLLIALLFTILLYGQAGVTICWDTSFSMKDRDIQKEFDFLDNYFSKNKNTTAALLTFKNRVDKPEEYGIVDGNWQSLKEKLQNTVYDGATSYKGLSGYISGGDVFLFTDGLQNLFINNPKFDGKLYILNTNANYSKENLEYITLLNKGRLINLAMSKPGLATKKDLLQYGGQVYDNNEIASDISIGIKGTEKIVPLEKDGSFSIKAKPGDTLLFFQQDKTIVEKELGKNQGINVWIESEGIRLEEVVINAKRDNVEKDRVQTASGLQDKESVGYAVQKVKGEDLVATSTDVSQAVEGKFTGLSKGSNDDLSQTVIRGMNTFNSNNYAAISIDGVVIAQSNSRTGQTQLSDFIDVTNVADITVLKGYAATVLYGTLGSNGVIEITTKTGAAMKSAGKENKNTALVKNNIYEGKIGASKRSFETPYLKSLRKETSILDAYNLYLDQRESFSEDPAYLIDLYDLFHETNEALANQIVSNIIEKEESSLAELRSMLLKVSSNGNNQLALETAQTILTRYPQQIQSYFDLAIANKAVGELQLALDMLLAIENGSINPDLNFSGLQKMADNEIRNLVRQKKNELETSKIEVKHLKPPALDVRIVFDWNNADAEFELQFVNPQKRFFKWLHTRNNPERIQDELQNGYNQEEFEIEGGDKGEWQINVKYLGNRTPGNEAPTFLKCIVQYNFGKPSERTKEQVLRLFKVGHEELVAKITTK